MYKLELLIGENIVSTTFFRKNPTIKQTRISIENVAKLFGVSELDVKPNLVNLDKEGTLSAIQDIDNIHLKQLKRKNR